MSHDTNEGTPQEATEYQAPQVRSLGSIHELTQGGLFGGGGSPFPGQNPPWGSHSW